MNELTENWDILLVSLLYFHYIQFGAGYCYMITKENFFTKTANVTQDCLFNIVTYYGIEKYLKYFNSL